MRLRDYLKEQRYGFQMDYEERDPDRTVNYKTVTDAYDAHGDEVKGLKKGKTQIWYMRKEVFRDLNMGYDFAMKYSPENVPSTPLVPKELEQTHVLLGTIQEKSLPKIFRLMQGELWSPYGEAKDLITKKKLHHTSMSVGDIIGIGKKYFMVDKSGFKAL